MKNVDKHPKTGIYRVRLTFPVHLHKLLGRGSVTKSLKTRSANDAYRLAIPVIDELHRLWDEAEKIYQAERSGEQVRLGLTIDAGVKLIEQWRDTYLANVVRVMSAGEGETGNYLALGESVEEDKKILYSTPGLLTKLYYSNTPVDLPILHRTLDRILRSAAFILPERHRMREALIGTLRKAIGTIRSRDEGWKGGDWSSDTMPPAPPDPVPAQTKAATPAPLAAPPASVQRQVRLHQLLETHIDRRKSKSTVEQTLAVKQLCGFVGHSDPFAHEITFEQADQFYETLRWLPKAMTAQLRMRPLADVAADMRSGLLNRPRASSATAAKKVQLLKAMFNFAIDRDLMTGKNPFAGLTGPKDSRPDTRRRSFSSNDLHAIFSTPVFAGCASYKAWRDPGQVLIANHRFWLPLLALVTGSRLEEIGQLLVSDIRKENNILFMRITEEVDSEKSVIVDPKKSVKTQTSVRTVPFHQIVLDAGFEEYWRWVEQEGHQMLFPELPANGKRTKEASRWFNRDLIRSLAGVTDRGKVFHSFRHGFKDRCRAAKLRRDLHDALTGHSSGTAGEGYGEGLMLDDLKEGIDALTFPGFPGVPPRKGQYKLTPGIGIEIA